MKKIVTYFALLLAVSTNGEASTLSIPDGVTLTGPSASGTAMTLGNTETVTGAKTFTAPTVLSRADVTKIVTPITDLSTVGAGGTAQLTDTATTFRAVFSGATAAIGLPSTPPDGKLVLHGNSTFSGGPQTITVPSLIRPESDIDTPTTTFVIPATSNGKWTAEFTAIDGAFVKFSVVGDTLAPVSGGGYTPMIWNSEGQVSPLANTTYYFGVMGIGLGAAGINDDSHRKYVPKTGIINIIELRQRNNGTLSTDTATFSVYKNGATDSATFTADFSPGYQIFRVTNLNFPVTAGDTISIKMVTPTSWATATPTNVRGEVTLYIE